MNEKDRRFDVVLIAVVAVTAASIAFAVFSVRKAKKELPVSIYVSKEYAVYLPIVTSQLVIFGAQVEGATVKKLSYLREGQWWQTGVYWHLVETSPGVYSWPSDLDNVMQYNSNPVIFNTRGTPLFYRTDSAYSCSPPKKDYYIKYADYVKAMIGRYAEYGLVGFTIWNEPEPSPDQTNPNWNLPYFGCWGDAELYADFTKFVYSSVKAEYPDILIISGEFMGIDTAWDADAISHGMAGDLFSFHCYVWSLGECDAKIAYMVSLAPHKKWVMTETSMLSETGGSDFRSLQGQHASHIRDNFRTLGLLGALWYTVADNGWRNSDLCFGGICYPAYDEWVWPEQTAR